jgi:hypothetical protein
VGQFSTIADTKLGPEIDGPLIPPNPWPDDPNSRFWNCYNAWDIRVPGTQEYQWAIEKEKVWELRMLREKERRIEQETLKAERPTRKHNGRPPVKLRDAA